MIDDNLQDQLLYYLHDNRQQSSQKKRLNVLLPTKLLNNQKSPNILWKNKKIKNTCKETCIIECEKMERQIQMYWVFTLEWYFNVVSLIYFIKMLHLDNWVFTY